MRFVSYQRVVINDANVAEGVEIIQSDGTLHQISLSQKGQVIITAGAINTPKILMHSGIGHGEDLNDLDIPVKKHLPRVGMNLQDHPVLGMSFRSVDTRPFDLHAELSKYFDAMSQNKTNPLDYGLMGSAGISAGAFLIPPGSIIPEIQLTFFPRKSEPHVSNSSALNHQTEILFTVALLTPTARNRVILTSKNPNSSPRIVPEVPAKESEHLSSTDQWKLSWTITVVRQIAATMQAKGLMGSEILPGVQVNSFEDLNAYVRSAIFRNSHWVGSAAMGHTQEQAVVDEHLRVFGIQKLRVADASVIPVIPNGNVHSSVLMVASHAAEIIKEEEEKEKENVINNKKNPHQLSA
jgi:choline dehydrogenase-like flavoprotein